MEKSKMKTFLSTLAASAALAFALGLAAAPASAWCYSGCDTTYYGNYSAGGYASNDGSAYGDYTKGWSKTTKELYGGADVNQYGVTVYAGSNFATKGGTSAYGHGYGGTAVGTTEAGVVNGGATVNWGKVYALPSQ